MKNLLILLVLISNCTYSQSFTELSHKYYVLSENNKFWKDSIVSETKFKISSKVISYKTGNITKVFKVISSDKDLSIDEEDTIFRVYCKDFNNADTEIIFLTSKNKEKYIYILSDYNQISFEIN